MITEMFTTKQEIKDFLKKHKVFQKNYKIHKDLTVEILNGELDLSGADIKIIPFKFIGVERLSVSYTKIESLEDLNLPEGIKILFISNTPLKSTKGLPNTVIEIGISNTQIESFKGLPEGLQNIWAAFNPLKSTSGLPSTVKHLDIRGTYVESFKDLPKGLEMLWTFASKFLKSRNDLPTGCKVYG